MDTNNIKKPNNNNKPRNNQPTNQPKKQNKTIMRVPAFHVLFACHCCLTGRYLKPITQITYLPVAFVIVAVVIVLLVRCC